MHSTRYAVLVNEAYINCFIGIGYKTDEHLYSRVESLLSWIVWWNIRLCLNTVVENTLKQEFPHV